MLVWRACCICLIPAERSRPLPDPGRAALALSDPTERSRRMLQLAGLEALMADGGEEEEMRAMAREERAGLLEEVGGRALFLWVMWLLGVVWLGACGMLAA